MGKFHSLPLFTDAYLADTTHLTGVESGAYLHLLMAAWRTPDCSLPDDDCRLARMARFDLRTWRRIKPAVMAFWQLDAGRWSQKRLSKEHAYVSQNASQQSQNAHARWDRKFLESLNGGDATALPNACQTDAPTPTPIRKKDSISLKSDWPATYREEFWMAYPRKIGKKAAFKKLEALYRTGEVPWVKFLAAVRSAGKGASEPRFIPHPATWLNRGGWDDEPLPQQPGMFKLPTREGIL